MPKNIPESDFETLLKRIRVSLSDADSYTRRNQRLNSILGLVTIVGSALTAFLTALTAAQGPTVIPGVLDWQVTCFIGAVLSFVTTICSGVSQQMNISQRLILGSQCVGRLRALELVATTQTRGSEEITNEYAEILRTYAETVSK
ncbi:MAG: hypothetical protein JNM02_12615 [Anaerolineales bacterium]|nr:hypothetical protein [Anaerolineales bacterium]